MLQFNFNTETGTFSLDQEIDGIKVECHLLKFKMVEKFSVQLLLHHQII